MNTEGTQDDYSTRTNDGPIRDTSGRARSARLWPVAQKDVAQDLTITVVVPAHDEVECLADTLDALLRQTEAPDRIIVVDDGSTDGTSAVAAEYPVEVVRNDVALGSKARVVNYVMAEVDTDLVINVDGDTKLCPDYIRLVKAPFADPKVAVVAGVVLTQTPHGMFQRSRMIEYLFGQTLFRPIQNGWASLTVAPGCAAVYRRDVFAAAGGFPDGTIAEDMDYTWRAMLAGGKAVFVPQAEAYVVDPATAAQLKAQLWRWLAGYFQCVRLHWKEVIRTKRILALLVVVSVWDIFSLPILLSAPFVFAPGDESIEAMGVYLAIAWLGSDLLITLPVVLYAARKRRISLRWALCNFPLIWVNRPFNLYYATKAMVWELFLVPLGWKTSLSTWHKGH